jgi:hypothetical protein
MICMMTHIGMDASFLALVFSENKTFHRLRTRATIPGTIDTLRIITRHVRLVRMNYLPCLLMSLPLSSISRACGVANVPLESGLQGSRQQKMLLDRK